VKDKGEDCDPPGTPCPGQGGRCSDGCKCG
jgi:hypothetical protein